MSDTTEDQIEFFINSINTIEEYNELMKGLQKDGSRITSSQNSILSKITSLMHSLIIHAEKLPEEESKQYYANKINVFIKDIRIKHCIQFPKDFELILLSLFLRFYSNKLDEIINKSAEKMDKEGNEHLENAIVISTVIGFLNSIISQLSNKMNMRELLNNVDQGDDKSFFKAITIDKTLISSEYVEKGMNQSRASGDKESHTKLGKALIKSPLERVDRHGETYAVLD